MKVLPPLPADTIGLCCREAYDLHRLPPLPDGLRSLDCTFTAIRTLPPLPRGLTTLHYMDCNPLELPEGLEELTVMQSYCRPPITLPPLPPRLRLLNCQNCNLTELPRLPATLQELRAMDNELTTLPAPMPPLRYLDLRWNPITSLPPLREGLTHLLVNFLAMAYLPILPDSFLVTRPNNPIATWELEEREKASKERSLARCGVIKEGLMQNRWHPTRIGPLIEAGWDVEDI